MSEITIIKCDGVGCENQVGMGRPADFTALEVAETAGWSKDEFDADFCPSCQEAAKKLEESKATGDDLAAFGALVGDEADKLDAEAQALGLEKKIDPQELDNRVEDMVRAMKKDLKKRKMSKEFIEEAVQVFREEAAKLRERI